MTNGLSSSVETIAFIGLSCASARIAHDDTLPRRTRPAPYVYTVREVRAIMKAAKSIGPRKSLRPFVISTLIGLLYATGLRIGEALKLKLIDSMLIYVGSY